MSNFDEEKEEEKPILENPAISYSEDLVAGSVTFTHENWVLSLILERANSQVIFEATLGADMWLAAALAADLDMTEADDLYKWSVSGQ